MDPNAALEKIRDLLHTSTAYSERGLNWWESAELIEQVESLDEWLSRGGFLPEAWQR